ncbi:MAG TPA: tetratricopeptide repeat protein [Oculatellaceae cyanobacterium]
MTSLSSRAFVHANLLKPSSPGLFDCRGRLRSKLSLGVALVVLLVSASTSSSSFAAAAKARRRSSGGGGGGSSGMPVVNEANMNPLDHNNRGVEYGRRGLWPQAIAEHETALNGDPENPQFRTNLSAALLKYGQSLASQKKWPQAASHLRQALYVDPNNQDAAILLDTCVKAMGGDPNNHSKMGEDLDVAGNYPEAIAEYRRATRADDSGISYANLGRVLMKQGASSPARLVEGYKMMRTAVGKNWEPDQQIELSKCHCQLGNILKEYAFTARERGATDVALKRLMNASVEYRRAVQINPLNFDAISGLIEVGREATAIKPSFDNHLMLGGAYVLRGDLDRAKHEYEECNKADPNNEMLNQARKAYHFAVVSSTQHADMVPRSITVAEDALKKNPNDALWLYIWGMAKESQGDRESAMKAYNKAYSIMPGLPKLKERMGIAGTAKPASAASGTSSAAPGGTGAAASAAPAAAAVPPAPPVNPKELEMLASAQSKSRNGDLDGALKDCSDLLEKNSQNGDAWLLQGHIQEKKGLLDDASVSYRQAVYLKAAGADEAARQVDSSRVAKPMEEADKQMAAGDMVAASATLKEIVSLAPNLPGPHKKLADVLEKLGDSKEAERERKRAGELDKK